MAGITYPDVVATAFPNVVQKLGDIVCANPGPLPLGQINVGSEFNGPAPTGIYKRYDNRFIRNS